MAHQDTWNIFLMLISFSQQGHGESVTRCYNEMFDSLMCLPGTGISVERIHAYASTTGGPTGLCHRSQDNCTELSFSNRDFHARARAVCDGRLACDNLTADVDKVYCPVPDTRVDLSYATIAYVCEPDVKNDFRYAFSCFNQTFNNLACDGGTVIDVTVVYVGVTDVTTGGCSMVPVGGCVYRFRDATFFPDSLSELCNGRVECRDARAYDRPGICRSTAETQYTMIVYQCVTPTVSRCYNEKFDSLMCLPGTGISVQRINVYASTTGGPMGLCHRSRDNCTEQLPPNRAFPARARAACDGRLTCENLAADLNKVYCEVLDTRVDLSYTIIQFICETEQREDFRYVSSCFNQTFNNLACDGGNVIDVTDVYVGVTDVTTGGCSMVPVGGCVYRFPDTLLITTSYRELCNGRVECRDARSYDIITGVCQPTSQAEYTMIHYQCVKSGVTKTTTLATTTTKLPETNTSSMSATLGKNTRTDTYPDTDATESTDPGCVGDGLPIALCRSTSENLQTTGLTFGESGPNSINMLALAVALPAVVLCVMAIAVAVVFALKRRNRQKQNAAGSSLTTTEHIYANQSVSTEAEYVNQKFSPPERTPDEIPLTTGEISSERVQYGNAPPAASATYEEVNRVHTDPYTTSQYTSLSVSQREIRGVGNMPYENVTLPEAVQGDGEDVEYLSLHGSHREDSQASVYSSLHG